MMIFQVVLEIFPADFAFPLQSSQFKFWQTNIGNRGWSLEYRSLGRGIKEFLLSFSQAEQKKPVTKKPISNLFLETGSIEITDMNIEEALKSAPENLNKYKKEWYQKVEDDSKKLLDIGEAALAQDT